MDAWTLNLTPGGHLGPFLGMPGLAGFWRGFGERRPRANRRRHRRHAGDAVRRVHNDLPPRGVEASGAVGDGDFGVVGARGVRDVVGALELGAMPTPQAWACEAENSIAFEEDTSSPMSPISQRPNNHLKWIGVIQGSRVHATAWAWHPARHLFRESP